MSELKSTRRFGRIAYQKAAQKGGHRAIVPEGPSQYWEDLPPGVRLAWDDIADAVIADFLELAIGHFKGEDVPADTD